MDDRLDATGTGPVAAPAWVPESRNGTMDKSASGRRSLRLSRAFWASVAAAVHLGFAFFYVPLDRTLFQDPIYNDDYSFHYWWGQVAARLEAETGMRHGWDPHFMAGYPFSWIVDTSGLLYAKLFLWFSRVDPTLVFNLYIFAACSLIPLVAFLTARAFGLAGSGALLYAFLSVLSTWLSHNAMYIDDGMVNWLLACHLWALSTGLAWRFLCRGGFLSWVSLVAMVLFLPYLHQVTLPMVAVSLCLLLVWARGMGSLSLRKILGLALACLAAVVVHSGWVREMWVFLPTFDLAFIHDDYKAFMANPFLSLTDLLDPFKLLAFLGCGLLALKRRRASLANRGRCARGAGRAGQHLPPPGAAVRFPALFLMLLCLGFFLLAYVSPFAIDMSKANNLRFSVPCLTTLLLLISGDPGAGAAFRRLSGRPWNVACLVVAGMLLARGIAHKPKELKTVYPEEFKELVEVLATHTDPSARILLEDGAHSFSHPEYEGGHPLFGGHLLSRLSLMVDRQFLGGPHSVVGIREHFATFENGRLLGRPIADWSAESFFESARVYNLGWVVCWHEESKKFFGDEWRGRIRRIATAGRFEVYEIVRDRSFLLGASGILEATYNTISIKELRPERGADSVIVLYHWNDDWVTLPATELRRAVLNDDPVGFIELVNPPAEIELRFGRGGS